LSQRLICRAGEIKPPSPDVSFPRRRASIGDRYGPQDVTPQADAQSQPCARPSSTPGLNQLIAPGCGLEAAARQPHYLYSGSRELRLRSATRLPNVSVARPRLSIARSSLGSILRRAALADLADLVLDSRIGSLLAELARLVLHRRAELNPPVIPSPREFESGASLRKAPAPVIGWRSRPRAWQLCSCYSASSARRLPACGETRWRPLI
jgi:hypothetical protein